MTICLGRAALAALLTLGAAATAHAQITTVVAQPKRNEPNQQQVAQREQAAQDSVARVTLTGMTQWVDSAAASLAVRPDTTGAARSADSSAAQAPVRTTTDSSVVTRDAKGEVDLRSGARALGTLWRCSAPGHPHETRHHPSRPSLTPEWYPVSAAAPRQWFPPAPPPGPCQVVRRVTRRPSRPTASCPSA